MSEVYKGEGYAIEIDQSPSNPREDDNMGVMVCWHSRYTLGDKQPTLSPYKWLEEALNYTAKQADDMESRIRLECMKTNENTFRSIYNHVMGEFEKENLVLPIYMYDHSGITISTSPFSCKWDSGQLGFIYVPHRSIQDEYGVVDKESIAKATDVIQSEVQIYDAYLKGEVYGYVLDNGDSCWGFYSIDEAKESAEAELRAITCKTKTTGERETGTSIRQVV